MTTASNATFHVVDGLEFTIALADLPGPEEMATIDLGGGFHALIENRNERVPEPEERPETARPPHWYAVARGEAKATVTHAVKVRDGLRTVPETYTLCSSGRNKRARGIRSGVALTAVTCVHCTSRLRAAGALVLAEVPESGI